MAAGVPDAKPIAKQGDYEIRFEPCLKRVRVEYGGMLVADSTRAIIVRETRAPPVHYLPHDDVRMDLLERTPLRTHCPFRGDASYWTLRVGDQVAENAAWSYEEPYADAEPIRGHLAFYRDKIAALYEGDQEAAFLDTEGRRRARQSDRRLADRRGVEGAGQRGPDGAVLRIPCGRPATRSRVPPSSFPTLHPQVFATVLVWREDVPARARRVRAARHSAAAAIRRQPVRPDHPRRGRRAAAPRGSRT